MNCEFPVVELITCLWNCATRHAGYINFEGNLKDLKTAMNELQELKKDVEMDHRESMEQQHQLAGWLQRVDDMGAEVDALIDRGAREIENTCLGGYCPKNCWSSYKIGKNIETTLIQVENHKTKGQLFKPDALVKALRTIRQDSVGTIGLYGPGGVGKTRLMTQINDNLLDSQQQQQPFDLVIWVEVSQDPNPEKILSEIARGIGFLEDSWKGRSANEKIEDVLKVLSNKKFVLLLDDVWEKVDLVEVGVPPPRENSSKVLFTTRSEEVCNQMGADEKINVGCMEWEKAWKLFREKVGEVLLNADEGIQKEAKTIAKMCNGLPLALITVARAMASKKELQEWLDSADILSKSIIEFSAVDNPLFPLIKFSYDSLPSEKVKSCLLYCTLFPEDFSINKFNLIDYWIGEGFLGDAHCAIKEGYEVIGILLDACLLEDVGKYVKMHDAIREAGLWIASECGKVKNKYLVEAGAKLMEAPELGRWEGLRRMSLMANQIQNLTKSPRCLDLLTLLLANNNLKVITNSFFQWMPTVKSLDLSENRELTDLPSGISRLHSLQYLNLSRTGIKELPIALKNLVGLKCLNLEYTYDLHTIQLQVLSGFSDLIVLRMVHCASSDRVVGDGMMAGGHEALAKDLQSLQHLNALTISIRSEYALRIFASFNMFHACTQALSLHNFRHSRSLDVSFIERMQRLSDLEFIDCINLKELRIESPRERCFNNLHRLSIVNCSKLQDLTWLAFAPNLEFLTVSRCSNMEEIIDQGKSGEGNLNTFEKLEVLRLVSLPQLKWIHRNSLPFYHLKEIVVDECPKLKKLPLNSESAKGQRIVIQGWEDWWQNLEWENEAARSTFLHSFKACMY